MKVVVAPQGFKEGLIGYDVASAIADGVRRAWPHADVELLPVADGGDGTLQSLVDASGGKIHAAEVQDPLGRPINAEWGALGDGKTAVIEMARCSGLALLQPDERNPRSATTHGTGELMLAAIRAGHRRLIIGIGGSATNDGGAGMAQALGARLLDDAGDDLPPGGAALADLATIDVAGIHPQLREATVDVACDVNNPLCGPTGASAIFGPQKGADADAVQQLDRALARYSEVIHRDLGRDVAQVPGAGAAGGLGAGLIAFTNATLRPGADIVMDALDVDARIADADLVIVGEGQIDRSTAFNKAPVAVAGRAAARGIPTIAIAGSLGDGWRAVLEQGIAAAFSIVDRPMTLDEAKSHAPQLLATVAEQACRAISIRIDTGVA